MKYNFNKAELSNFVSLVIDYRGKTPKKLGGEWANEGIRALSAKNVKTGSLVSLETIRYVSEELYIKWMKDEVQRGDIFVTSEAPCGEVFYWDSDEKIVLSQRLFCLRINEKIDSRYLYYYMTTSKFKNEMLSRATGTTVIGLRQPELLKCNVEFPEIEVQRKIAHILKTIDDKIKINNELQDLYLEQIKTIIQEYFFNDERLNNDHWFKINLPEVADFYNGYSYSGNELIPSHIAMATIKNFKRNGGFKLEGFKEICPQKNKITHELELYDTFVAHTDLTQNAEVVGNAEMLLSKNGYNKIIMSMDLVKVLPKKDKISKFILAGILGNRNFKKHCLGYVNGTTVLHLNKQALQEFNFNFTNDHDLLESIDKRLKNLYQNIGVLFDNNIILEELKNTLITKLMIGEIDLDKIKI